MYQMKRNVAALKQIKMKTIGVKTKPILYTVRNTYTANLLPFHMKQLNCV